MDYKKKIAQAERIAKLLDGKKTAEEIRLELKEEGFYERDIDSIMISARNFLKEKYQLKIQDYLQENKQIQESEEFSSLDNETLDKLIEKESQVIALQERRKITKLCRDGLSPDEILAQVNTRFLSTEKALQQLAEIEKARDQNSGSSRAINIFGGIGLILLTIGIAAASGRLFYVLPIIGLVMIVKGFMTKRMEYED